jgi:hypothetical protein
MNRKRTFQALLRLSGRSQSQFAREHGRSPTLLCLVLDGKVTSAPTNKLIDDFIARHGTNLSRQLSRQFRTAA